MKRYYVYVWGYRVKCVGFVCMLFEIQKYTSKKIRQNCLFHTTPEISRL